MHPREPKPYGFNYHLLVVALTFVAIAAVVVATFSECSPSHIQDYVYNLLQGVEQSFCGGTP